MKLKPFIMDFVYSSFGVVLYNAIIQFVINPYLNRTVGSDIFGTILSLLSVIALFATTFGVGCNNSRMLAESEHREINDDFIYCIFKMCLFSSILISIIIFFFYNDKLDGSILSIFLCIFTILRYYMDVKYKIDLNYKGFCIYYIAIAFGYTIGILFYKITGIWQIIYLTGEVLAIGICIFPIYKKRKIVKSKYYSKHFRSAIMLSISMFMTNSIIQLDRVLLSILSTGTSVTIFYVATLCGKIIALVVVPLNGVVIGYLIKNEKKMSNGLLGILIIIIFFVTFIFAGIGMLFSYILIPIMYPEIFCMAKPILFIANLGQAFFFSSEVCQIIILKDTKERIQLFVNTICFFVLCILGTGLTLRFDYYGMTYAVLITTIIKFVLTSILGWNYLKKAR